jgi:7,8-dihydropterin-6-yl-methyl-4-(beta-D-ribofuranosyl)aminobenzene 5'-phosphate synthase
VRPVARGRGERRDRSAFSGLAFSDAGCSAIRLDTIATGAYAPGHGIRQTICFALREHQEATMSHPLENIGRRQFLGGASATAFGSAFASLLGAPGVARAQPLTGPVPEVDRLAVRVVTDSYHHAFEPPRRAGEVEVQRFSFALSKDPPRKALQNEWGLALHLESTRGAERRLVLIDFGFTPETLNNNLELLGIDPGQLDALVLSHGHYDHFGGLVGFLQAHRTRLKPGLPLYLGGEECFCTREVGVGTAAGNFGTLDRKAIADAGLKVLFAEQPSLVGDHAFTTGRIVRGSFERVFAPTRMYVGLRDGVGCAPEGLPAEKRTLTVVPDDFDHEQATCVNVKGKGLVVMTSCGHRGVVNSVRAAMRTSGVDKVHAVLGGFHLAPHPIDYQRETLAGLKEIALDYLIPMHCSGETFISIAMQEMPTKTIRSSTGSRFVFGA